MVFYLKVYAHDHKGIKAAVRAVYDNVAVRVVAQWIAL
jgi:hypothetical protein